MSKQKLKRAALLRIGGYYILNDAPVVFTLMAYERKSATKFFTTTYNPFNLVTGEPEPLNLDELVGCYRPVRKSELRRYFSVLIAYFNKKGGNNE